MQSLLLLTTSLALANCGLLGHISYAPNSIYNQPQPFTYQDATKVSYSSISHPVYSAPSTYNQQQQQQQPLQQQQFNYQPTGYAQYSPIQSNYIQSPAAAPQPIQMSYQKFSYGGPLVQNVIPHHQAQYYPNTPSQQPSFTAFTNYGNSPVIGGPLAPGFGQAFTNHQQQQPQAQLQYAPIQQQSVPVQNNYQSVQPLPQQVTARPVQKVTTVQHFPAIPVVTQNNYAVNPKNAHHYPATITKSSNVPYQSLLGQPTARVQQQPNFIGGGGSGASFTQSKTTTGNSVFRTSFTVAANPSQQIVTPARFPTASPIARSPLPTVVPPRSVLFGQQQPQQQQPQRPVSQVITSGSYFTQTVTPTASAVSPARSSVVAVAPLATNPINIPSNSFIAPVQQNTNTNNNHIIYNIQPKVQQPSNTYNSNNNNNQIYNQQTKYSPSTSVSHARFQGMGVQYEW